MKYYQFKLGSIEAEQMWDFAQKNQVNIHFEGKEESPEILGSIDDLFRQKYIYGGYMSEETYLMFRLTVPAVAAEDGFEYTASS